jgi:hypothetical protein
MLLTDSHFKGEKAAQGVHCPQSERRTTESSESGKEFRSAPRIVDRRRRGGTIPYVLHNKPKKTTKIKIDKPTFPISVLRLVSGFCRRERGVLFETPA